MDLANRSSLGAFGRVSEGEYAAGLGKYVAAHTVRPMHIRGYWGLMSKPRADRGRLRGHRHRCLLLFAALKHSLSAKAQMPGYISSEQRQGRLRKDISEASQFRTEVTRSCGGAARPRSKLLLPRNDPEQLPGHAAPLTGIRDSCGHPRAASSYRKPQLSAWQAEGRGAPVGYGGDSRNGIWVLNACMIALRPASASVLTTDLRMMPQAMLPLRRKAPRV